MALDAKIALKVVAALTGSLDLGGVRAPLEVSQVIDLDDGTSSGQADKIWSDRRTISASSSENIDLAGALTDALGAALTFARVKALIIKASSANVNNVVVGGHGSAAWATWVSDATDKVVVRPGGFLAFAAPDGTAYAVTATTADMLTVANSSSGSSVTYDIVIIGASA